MTNEVQFNKIEAFLSNKNGHTMVIIKTAR
jgi:hypothetical protein